MNGKKKAPLMVQWNSYKGFFTEGLLLAGFFMQTERH